MTNFTGGNGFYELQLSPSIYTDITIQIPDSVAYDIIWRTNDATEVYHINNEFGVVTAIQPEIAHPKYRIVVNNKKLKVTSELPLYNTLILIDSKGAVVTKRENFQSEVILDLSGLRDGVYIVNIFNNEIVHSQKILIYN